MFTPQEAALDALENKYGRNTETATRVITEDHIGFRLVSVRWGNKADGKPLWLSATGETWEEALDALAKRVKR